MQTYPRTRPFLYSCSRTRVLADNAEQFYIQKYNKYINTEKFLEFASSLVCSLMDFLGWGAAKMLRYVQL